MYTIALWSKSITRAHGSLIYDRQYAVRADGVISTRLDLFKGRRDLASLETDGWKLLKRKRAAKTAMLEVEAIDAVLLPKGYKRLI